MTYQFTRRIDRGNVDDRERTRGLPLLSTPQLAADDYPSGVTRDSIEQLVLTARFVGANPNLDVVAEGLTEYKCNYFLGNDSSKWHTDVPNYSAVTLKDIYPGIDLRYSGDSGGQVAYEFVAAPSADIAQIKVAYEGAGETWPDADGRLILKTRWGDMIAAIKSPTNGILSGKASLLQASEQTIEFEGDHSARFTTGNASRQELDTLAVELIYSTYLGGEYDPDQGYRIAIDDSGNAYVTGWTFSLDFPTVNPFQTYQWEGINHSHVYVSKLSSSGSSLIYSTYLSGTDEDWGWGIAVDSSGNAYVAGYTASSDFPTFNPYQTDQGGYDAFVTKLNSAGNGLIYSTYLGGSNGDYAWEIAIDGGGNAYVTGHTGSPDFPTVNPYQMYQGGVDVFVTKLSSSGTSLVYSTCLGGVGYDRTRDIAVDADGNAYVTGITNSTDFPTLNPYQATYSVPGEVVCYYGDAFVTKLSSSGNSLIYSTYLGGGDGDYAYGMTVDRNGYAYVTGVTCSHDFPTRNPLQGTNESHDCGGNGFVTKLSTSGDALMYSTYLGGNGADQANNVAVDSNGIAYVVGFAHSSDFPTLHPYQLDPDQGENDAVVIKLSSSGRNLIYGTYLGGGGFDWGFGIAVDGSGNAYVTGATHSSDFPTLNAYKAIHRDGDRDVFVAKLGFCAGDADCDGVADGVDNCPGEPNPGQEDFDGDDIGDACDFVCGDANGDAIVNISDAVYLIAYVFAGGSAPSSLLSGDANCSGVVNISDAVYLIAYIFAGGSPPCTLCK